jgi:hypothetical protein
MSGSATKPNPRRSAAARENGRKGGVATSRNHSPDWLSKRGHNGGSTTLEMYSADFFRHAQAQRKIKRGWPQGKLRKAVQQVAEAVSKAGLTPANQAALNNMLAQG